MGLFNGLKGPPGIERFHKSKFIFLKMYSVGTIHNLRTITYSVRGFCRFYGVKLSTTKHVSIAKVTAVQKSYPFQTVQTLALTDNVLKASEKESGKKWCLFYGPKLNGTMFFQYWNNVAPLNLLLRETYASWNKESVLKRKSQEYEPLGSC